ncbi:hypothetical protein NVP1284A_70 [Vibrio phage 1.284.A._10N.286.55.A5]|nr:hypothetical protein NVP1284A_70 [Vibrio phage 1.284.A._10N.286.55.A5]
MKTFETERHNIPEGATHYRDECKDMHFVWIKFKDSKMMVWINAYWYEEDGFDNVKPIPQTNIETPEEKGALDLIDTTPQQYESVASKDVEWDGEGLPPVGCQCIFRPKNPELVKKYSVFSDAIGRKVTIMFHDEGLAVPKWAGRYESFRASDFAAIETPQQREERERLDNGQSLYELVQSLWCTVDSKYTPHPYSSPMVDDKTKEMYARLARAVDYRKEG